jgi:hypothetical protein
LAHVHDETGRATTVIDRPDNSSSRGTHPVGAKPAGTQSTFYEEARSKGPIMLTAEELRRVEAIERAADEELEAHRGER